VLAVRESEPWRGAPLAVSVGVAVLGEDGSDSATLVDAAERDAFAASATGVGIVGGVDPSGPPTRERPHGSGPRLVS
jgi:GGDEF domain-containing protein